jgi:hypothetical protein
MRIYDNISINFSEKEKCFNQIGRENQSTRFMFCNLFSEYSAVYEKMWKNMIEPDRSQMTVWCMGIPCWTTKATHSNSEY